MIHIQSYQRPIYQCSLRTWYVTQSTGIHRVSGKEENEHLLHGHLVTGAGLH